MHHIHVRIHRWVVWWFYVGAVCGVTALVNILGRDLTRAQERIILIIGVLHWLLGGLVCWALGGIRVRLPQPLDEHHPSAQTGNEKEWHSPSEFVLPGSNKTFLPAKY